MIRGRSTSEGRGPTEGGPARPVAIEHCPLCGLDFDTEGQGCRPSCPLAKGCRVICCPGCGYSFPQEIGLAGKLRRLIQRGTQEPR